jgi:hypothetical protein
VPKIETVVVLPFLCPPVMKARNTTTGQCQR